MDLVLNNLQRLICHKTQKPTNQPLTYHQSGRLRRSTVGLNKATSRPWVSLELNNVGKENNEIGNDLRLFFFKYKEAESVS